MDGGRRNRPRGVGRPAGRPGKRVRARYRARHWIRACQFALALPRRGRLSFLRPFVVAGGARRRGPRNGTPIALGWRRRCRGPTSSSPPHDPFETVQPTYSIASRMCRRSRTDGAARFAPAPRSSAGVRSQPVKSRRVRVRCRWFGPRGCSLRSLCSDRIRRYEGDIFDKPLPVATATLRRRA